MGGDGDPGVCPKRMVLGQGFGVEHVQRRMPDMAGIKRREKRLIVDQGPATGVQDHRPLGQQGKTLGVQKVPGFVC